MNQWKKLISLNLALAMLIGMIQPAVYAADETDPLLPETEQTEPLADDTEPETDPADTPVASGICGADLTWTLDSEGTLTISGTGEMYEYDTGSKPWSGHGSIKKVVLEEGVTSVGAYAFYSSYVIKVSLPSTLTSIGRLAFSYCSGLTNVIIPEGVTSIGDNAFYDCDGLTTIVIPEGVTSIGGSAFCSCDELTTVIIPGTVISWGGNVFSDCSSLSSVTLGYGIKYIPSFANCSALTSVSIPGSVTSIGGSAFENSGLTAISIPDSVTSIGSEAFRQCDDLTAVTIGSGITSIGSMAFAECATLETVDIDTYEILVSVSDNALHSSVSVNWKPVTDDTAVKTWDVNGSITATLYGDGTLKLSGSGAMPDYYDSNDMPWYSLRNNVKKVVVEDGITAVGQNAFYNHTALTDATIGPVTSIGNSAFYGCSALTDITVDAYKVQVSVGSNAFPEGTTVTWKNPEADTVLKTWYVNGSITATLYGDGTLKLSGSGAMPNYGTNGMPWYSLRSNVKKVVVEDGITTIGQNAFYNHTALTEATIGSVTSIGYDAFWGCSALADVTIDAYQAVVLVGADAFPEGATVTWKNPEADTVLKTWDVNGSITATLYGDGTLKLSGSDAMPNYGTNGMPWYSLRSNVKKVVVEDGITTVGQYAFYNHTALTEATIGAVTSIGYQAFWDCSALTKVTINAYEPQVSVGSNAFPSGVTVNWKAADSSTVLASWDIGAVDETDATATLYANGRLVITATNPTSVKNTNPWLNQYRAFITSVEIDSGISNVPYNAFNNCTALTSVSGLSYVTIIESGAFYGCTALKNVYLGYNIQQIYDQAFCNTGLTTLSIPDSVTYVGYRAFYDCRDLMSITWDAPNCSGFYDTCQTFGNAGINGDGITLKIGSSVKTIPAYMFYTSSSYAGTEPKLVEITGGKNVTQIGNFAFYRCIYLEEAALGASLEEIGQGAFNTCPELIEITFPESLSSIGDKAFFRTGLTTVNTNEELEEIGSLVFSECPAELILYVYQGSEAYSYAINNGLNYAFYTTYTLALMANWADGSNYDATVSPGEEVYLGEYSDSAVEEYSEACPGVTLLYWTTNPDGTGDQYGSYANVTLTENLTLYAQWAVPEYYQITLHGNHPDGEDFIINVQCIQGETLELGSWTEEATARGRAYSLDKEVYAWTTTEDATDPAGTSFGSIAAVTPTGDIDLYAQWQTINLEKHIVDEDDCGDNVSWVLYDFGTLVISGSGPMEDYGAKGAPWYSTRKYDRYDIQQVIVESGVTSVGEYAFYNCPNLTQVSLPDTLNYIGYRSFYGCKSLEQVDIDTYEMCVENDDGFDDDVILNWRIPDASELIATFYVGMEYETDVMARLYGDGRLMFSGVGYIMNDTPWSYCDDMITSVSVGSGITGILADFSDCENLATVTLPDTLEVIGEETFEYCDSLETVTIDTYEILVDNYCIFPEDAIVTWRICEPDVPVKTWQIGDDVTAALYVDGRLEITGTGVAEIAPWSRNITSVTVGEGVTELPFGAFQNCYDLTDVVLPITLRTLSSYLFANCRALETVTVPDNVVAIGNWTFSGCEALTSISLGTKLEVIGTGAFADCTELTAVVLPETLTELGADAFNYCSALTEIVIPNGVTQIESGMFEGCKNLASVTLPGELTAIESDAFRDCRKLESINLGKKIAYIGDYAFYRTALTQVNLDGDLEEIGRYAFSNTGLKEVKLGEKLQMIGSRAFSNCSDLVEVDFGDSACSIGSYAFYNCKALKTVTDTENVYELSSHAFMNCSALESIDSMPELDEIPMEAFSGCSALQQFTIGENVRYIDLSAFADTALTAVTIPDATTDIGDYAFNGCSALESLTVGTGVRWIGEHAFGNTPALKTIHWNAAACKNLNVVAFANAGSKTDGIAVTVGEEVTRIPAFLFADDLYDEYAPPKVKTVTMVGTSKLTDIGAYAFYCNPTLETVEVGGVLKYIGDCAFNTCTALTSMELPDTLLQVGDRALFRTALTHVDLYPDVQYIGDLAFGDNASDFTIYGCTGSYAEDYADANEILFVAYDTAGTENGMSWSLDLETGLLIVSGSGALSDATTPWKIYADAVTQVTVSDGITAIGANTFSDCKNLELAVLGADVETLDNTAFSGCYRLADVVFQGDVPQLTANGEAETENIPFVDHADMSVCYTTDTENWQNCNWQNCTFYKITLDRAALELMGNTDMLEYPLEYQISIEDFSGKTVDLSGYSTDLQNRYFRYASDANLVSWNSKTDGSGTKYELTEIVELADDQTLYAQWVPSHDVNVALQDKLTGYQFEETVKTGALLNLADHSYWARSIYYAVASHADLVAWNTEEDFSGTSYAADEAIRLQADISLYAQWQFKTFSVDGKEYPVNEPASGDGWSYRPGNWPALELNGYTGGSIVIPSNVNIDCFGENTITGSIVAEESLYLDMESGTTTIHSEETAITCGKYLDINMSDEDAQLIVTAELAVFTEDLYIGGYGKVDMTAQGENCLYATDYTSLNGGEMTFRASERALRAKRWYIDSDYLIYLSEDAETPASSYDKGSYLRLMPQYHQLTLHANGGTWGDQENPDKIVSKPNGKPLYLGKYSDQLSKSGYLLEKWINEDDTMYYLPYQYASTSDLILYAVWLEEMLEVGGERHSPKSACSGTGWSFTPAADGEMAKLVITEGYSGGPIYCTEDLDITVNASADITGAAAQPAVKVLGELTLTVSEDAQISLQGGSGTAAVSTKEAVQLFNYGSTTIRGGDGGSGIEQPVIVRNHGKLSVVGGLRAPALEDFSIWECSDTIVLIAGAEYDYAMNSGGYSVNLELKCYTGDNEATAVRSYLRARPYVRIQPKTILLTLNANGGTIDGSAIATEELAQNVENAFVMTVGSQPMMSGYTFTGWNTAADGSGTDYIPGQTYVAGELVDSLVLYAQWEPAGIEAVLGENGLMVTLPGADFEDAILLVAGYDADGKMLKSAIGARQTANKEQWVFDLQNDTAVVEWKLFFLHSMTYVPIREDYPLEISK